jgi:hypothetical protein
VFDGAQPARVPDQVIAYLRKRERNGVIELLAVFEGGRERVAVLLSLLGCVESLTGDVASAMRELGSLAAPPAFHPAS